MNKYIIKKNHQNNKNVLVYIPIILFLWVGVCEPLKQLIIKSISDGNGKYIGLANFNSYFNSSGLVGALINSLTVSAIVTIITVFLAYIISFGIVRTNIYGKGALKVMTQLPLFVPSIFPCFGLIYLLGGQGLISNYLEDFQLYGPVGVVIGGVIFTIPHAIILLSTALSGIDGRLYQAANTLGASPLKQFLSITVPNSMYGIISAFFVVFTLTMTDFGIAKVLAGQYPMLATEIYKQVIGQQNFSMGATISLILIVPTCIAFFIDSWAKKKQARLPSESFFIKPTESFLRDLVIFVLSWLSCGILLAVIGVVVWGSLISYWPYDFSFTFDNYDFESFGYGWYPYFNSLILAISVAFFGTVITFFTSYISLRVNTYFILKELVRFLALIPLSIPGTVLGLSYIFAFNIDNSVFSILQGGFLILIFNTVIHLFSVSYLAFGSTIGKLNKNYESVGLTLGVNNTITFFKIIIPLSKKTILDVFIYLFINALTTVSAVVFLYGSNTVLASIVILNMDDSGDIATASAMGTLILLTSLFAKLSHIFYESHSKNKLC